MKSLFVLFSLFFSISLLASNTIKFDVSEGPVVKKIKQRSGDLTLKFNVSSIEQILSSDNLGFTNDQELRIKGLKNFGKIGAPSLPAQSIIVEGSPAEFTVQVLRGDYEEILDVVPSSVKREKSRCDQCQHEVENRNIQNYTQDTPVFKIESLGDFRTTKLTRITVFPVQYDASSASTKVYPTMVANISKQGSRSWHEFENPTSILKESNLNKKYLIISPGKFTSNLAEFIKWKELMGYSVKLVELESIGKKFDVIKKFIQKEYMTTSFTYVLLVGDEDLFPTRYVKTYFDSKTPSDLTYFTMGGNNDFVPDVFSGRLVVANADDIKNQVDKIMEYEKAPSNTGGINSLIGIASNEGEDPTDEEYLAEIYKPLVEILKYNKFTFLQSQNSTASDITTALNRGAKWVNYVGHGSGESWSSIGDREYSIKDIAQINTVSQKPIIIDVSCENGRFRLNKFGERFMNQTKNGKPTGAAAYYGGSVSISWNPPSIMAIGINRFAVQKDVTHLGEALLAGQLFLMSNHDDIEDIKDNLEWYHLFGDPSMVLNL